MELRLNDSEGRTLERALGRRCAEMLAELVHTTDRTAHAELKASYEELDTLHKRVKGLLDGAARAAAPAASLGK